MPVQGQDLDIQHNMSFLCSLVLGEKWLFVLFMLVELLTINI